MKLIIYLICVLFTSLAQAQQEYPLLLVLDIEENSSDIQPEIYLMLTQDKGIILNDYGNKECDFELIASHDKTVIVAFNEPSHLNGYGRCASGTEKGFIRFRFSKNNDLLSDEKYLIESCLLSLEIQHEKTIQPNLLEYIYDNIQTSETYILQIDKSQATISKRKHN